MIDKDFWLYKRLFEPESQEELEFWEIRPTRELKREPTGMSIRELNRKLREIYTKHLMEMKAKNWQKKAQKIFEALKPRLEAADYKLYKIAEFLFKHFYLQPKHVRILLNVSYPTARSLIVSLRKLLQMRIPEKKYERTTITSSEFLNWLQSKMRDFELLKAKVEEKTPESVSWQEVFKVLEETKRVSLLEWVAKDDDEREREIIKRIEGE